MPAFDPRAILDVLHRAQVEFLVVGGIAAVAYGSPVATQDVDVMPERSLQNLARLSAALNELEARIRVEGIPDGFAFEHNARSLQAMTMLNLVTPHGPLDLVMQSGRHDYMSLNSAAEEVEIGGHPVRLASLDDIIRMKSEAGRVKDEAALPVLVALRRRLGARQD